MCLVWYVSPVEKREVIRRLNSLSTFIVANEFLVDIEGIVHQEIYSLLSTINNYRIAISDVI